MKIIPVKKYAMPDFPTHDILEEHPELLRLVPERWQRNPVVLSALAGICLLILSSKELNAAPWKSASRVAPIFQHGEGSGSFGCMVVNPPVFLSEAEARQVIIEEGKLAGITFVPDIQTIRSVSIPFTDSSMLTKEKASEKLKTRLLPLKLDGTDQKRKISYEYFSQLDFKLWEKKNGIQSSVYSYNVLKAAESLREGLNDAITSGTYAVFYDPMSRPGSVKLSYKDKSLTEDDWTAEYVRLDKEAKNAARDELRKQVKDFIVWMKAQGVI